MIEGQRQIRAEELAELERLTDEAVAKVEAEIAAGRMSEDHVREFREAQRAATVGELEALMQLTCAVARERGV